VEPTYYDKRKCQNCNAPISDQTHALRKSCPRIILEDGTIKSCKDDFHVKKNKRENIIFRNMIKHHKSMNKRIISLLRNVGANVTTEDLNRYGIVLFQPLKVSKNEYGEHSYTFMNHTIITINNNQFKIKNNESLLF
jgi:Zn-finger protein